MSWWLVGKNGSEIRVNAWRWRPTLELLKANHLIEDTRLEAMGYNGTGTEISAQEAEQIAQVVEGIVEKLDVQDRVLLDLSSTSEADTGQLYREEWEKNYSAPVAWLSEFASFCKSSGGFEVV